MLCDVTELKKDGINRNLIILVHDNIVLLSIKRSNKNNKKTKNNTELHYTLQSALVSGFTYDPKIMSRGTIGVP